MVIRKSQPERSWLRPYYDLSRLLAFTLIGLTLSASPDPGKHRWSELNIGPFNVATVSDIGAAREALVQLEQLRWVLGNLLESKDLPCLWPIRFLLTGQESEKRSARFSRSSSAGPESPDVLRWQAGQYLNVSPPGRPLPLGEVAILLLDANTPRLPAGVESGLRQLFSTLEAHGSRVTWGGQPLRPDLDWARMQLFATKFEYGASFHIFLTSLKGGSTLAAAERNAFGKTAAELEAEARANLAAGHWTAVPVSGRPLDSKRDFGEHSLDSNVAAVYLANWQVGDRPSAEAAYKSAIEAGPPAAPLGYEGLAALAQAQGENPRAYWDDAIRAGSRSAPLYVSAAEGLPEAEALPLLRRAAQLNDRWAVPVYRQVAFGTTADEKQTLLKAALKLDPRAYDYWIQLAHLQADGGQATAAQGSWLRAEDSAPTAHERERVHQLRLASEQHRLQAAEEARLRDREAVLLADEQAQQAQSDRVRRAEQKANQSLDNSSAEEKPTDAVAWNSLVREKKLSGTLARVDCLKGGWRLWVKDRAGASTELFLSKDTAAPLSCGVQVKPRGISLSYRVIQDDDRHTAGEVTSLDLK